MRNISNNKKIFTFICILTTLIILPICYAQEDSQSVENEVGFYYTVQKGDTLWDISDRFADSPFLWPDLWKDNQHILNPHLIYPGNRLLLFKKKDTDTVITKKVEEIVAVPQLPEIKEEIKSYKYFSIDAVGFIRKEPVLPIGSLFKVKDDKELASTGDLVYIRPGKNINFNPGARYTVFRTFGPLVDKKTKALIGTQHYLTGVVEIKEIEPLYAIAEIIKTYRAIAVNDLLMPFEPKSPEIPIIECEKGIDGAIISSEEKREIIGDNTVVFINKGIKDGIKPGQSYSIYYQDKQKISPDSKKEIYLAPVDFGSLIVLQTEQTTSSALVTRSDKDIYPGAKIRSPVN
ncbi:MAG: LysM peptidoglycan-binding domain-containing protein [Desulfobacterales bacterium]